MRSHDPNFSVELCRFIAESDGVTTVEIVNKFPDRRRISVRSAISRLLKTPDLVRATGPQRRLRYHCNHDDYLAFADARRQARGNDAGSNDRVEYKTVIVAELAIRLARDREAITAKELIKEFSRQTSGRLSRGRASIVLVYLAKLGYTSVARCGVTNVHCYVDGAIERFMRLKPKMKSFLMTDEDAIDPRAKVARTGPLKKQIPVKVAEKYALGSERVVKVLGQSDYKVERPHLAARTVFEFHHTL